MDCKICELISERNYDHCQLIPMGCGIDVTPELDRVFIALERCPRCGKPIVDLEASNEKDHI